MFRRLVATGLLLSLCALAQNDQIRTSFFPQPAYFRENYSSPNIHVELKPPVRLSDYVAGGKLELSLRSYTELVLANNTDIELARLAVETFKNAITRAFSPFDPFMTGSWSSTRNKQPATDALAGAVTLSQLTQPTSILYNQLLANGNQFTVGFGSTKSTTNSGFQTYNPAYNSTVALSFVQPLIRNRGAYVNRIPIMIARSRVRKNEYVLKDSLLRLIQNAELVYWLAVQLRENLRVQESALDLAQQFLKRSQRELELGAISKLDIYQPELQYAQAEGSVAQARYAVKQQDDALRKQIGADLDPEIRKLPIVLTESPTPPTAPRDLDPEAEVEKALTLRPDLRSQLQDLDVDDLTIKQVRNQMRPDLSLTGAYTAQGRGGTYFQRTNVFNSTGNSAVTKIIPGGFSDSIDQMFGFGFPIYAFGLRLRLPIRNRQSAADMADALVFKKIDSLQVRGAEQQIRLDVLTAINQVKSSEATVALALKALDFARKRMDAENKKYELGTSQIFLVLQAQSDLINAESNVVSQSVNYQRNVLNLLRMTGELLDARGVTVQ